MVVIYSVFYLQPAVVLLFSYYKEVVKLVLQQDMFFLLKHHPYAAKQEGVSNAVLGKWWIAALQYGSLVVIYKQVQETTCLFHAISSVFAYFGDHCVTKAINNKVYLKVPINKTKFQVINETFHNTKDG